MNVTACLIWIENGIVLFRVDAGKSVLGEGTKREVEDGLFLGAEKLAQANVVRNQGSDNAQRSASFGHVGDTRESASSEDEERQCEQAKQRNEPKALAEGGNGEEEGDHAPGDEVNPEGGVEFSSFSVCSADATAWDEDRREGHPERAKRRECSGAESVSLGEFPHAGKELSEAATENSHADNDVRVGDAPCAQVVQREDQSSGGK